MNKGVFWKIAGITALLMGLAALMAAFVSMDAGYQQECPVLELYACLEEGGAGQPYTYARIWIAVDDLDRDSTGEVQPVDIMGGTAHISWQTFQTAEEFQMFYQAQEQDHALASGAGRPPEGYVAELAYYQYQLGAGDYASDIYQYLNERYGTEASPVMVFSKNDQEDHCLSQLHPSAARDLVVKDRVLYGLERKDAVPGVPQEDMRKLLWGFGSQKLQVGTYNGGMMRGTYLDEEDIYWLDHDERVITLDDPVRSFTEVSAVEMNIGVRWIHFAMLKEADYQIRLHEGGPVLDIHFTFQKEIPADGFETPLYNGFCMSEPYIMRVTEQETGKLLQEMVVEMSIEVPDMIAFVDIDGDGYLDMKIDGPTHWHGARAVVDEFSRPSFLLWDPKDSVFVRKRKWEIDQIRNEDQQADGTRATSYLVQPGDTLWGISERFYGTGIHHTRIWAANTEILSRHRYLMPGMELEIPEVEQGMHPETDQKEER